MLFRVLTLSAILAAGAPVLASAQEAAPAPAATPNLASAAIPTDDNWHWAVTPYLWAPNINGNLNIQKPALTGGGTANIGVGIGPNKYLTNLNFAFLVAAEARKKRFTVLGDYINLNVSSTIASVTTISGPLGKVEIPLSSSINTHVFSSIATLGAGYTLTSSPSASLDAFVAARNIRLVTNVNYTVTGPIDLVPLNGSGSESVSLLDAVGGIRGRIAIGERFYLPFEADYGVGSNNNEWQYVASVGYAGRTNDVILGFRGLGVNQTNSGAVLVNSRFSGPLLALRIHW
jgi:hypothetical protein